MGSNLLKIVTYKHEYTHITKSQLGFDPSLKYLACLATLKICDITKVTIVH